MVRSFGGKPIPMHAGVSASDTIQVYDPPMCCSTGLCGPGVDPHLLQAARDLRYFEAEGVKFERLKNTSLPVECGSGGLTKFNRVSRGLEKTHWLDAACVGASTPPVLSVGKAIKPLLIKATGHGRRQICVTDKYGFPKQHKKRTKTFLGYATGDIVKGTHKGRIAIRHRPSFRLGKIDIHPKYIRRVQRADGYEYTR